VVTVPVDGSAAEESVLVEESVLDVAEPSGVTVSVTVLGAAADMESNGEHAVAWLASSSVAVVNSLSIVCCCWITACCAACTAATNVCRSLPLADGAPLEADDARVGAAGEVVAAAEADREPEDEDPDPPEPEPEPPDEPEPEPDEPEPEPDEPDPPDALADPVEDPEPDPPLLPDDPPEEAADDVESLVSAV
jgi:hypothetical protein